MMLLPIRHPMAKSILACVLAVCSLCIAACVSPQSTSADTQALTPAPIDSHTVFVVSNGWHTGIVLRRAAIPPHLIPETRDFPEATYLEFGWGDAEFYPANEVTAGMSLRAALIPTPSVMHLAGYGSDPVRRYPKSEVVGLQLDVPALQALATYIDGSFHREETQTAQSVGPGLYARSLFYPAKGKFHMFNTCNTWTAGALIAGGMNKIDKNTTKADSLMTQLKYGEHWPALPQTDGN